MVVLISQHLPDAVRGIMKLWFIEVKPNVFISGIKDNTAKKVVQHLIQSCPSNSSILIFQSHNLPPYYKITIVGMDYNKVVNYNGLDLIRLQGSQDVKNP